MIVRNLITNETVTTAGTLLVGSIAPGIYRPIRFEQTSTVTSIFLRYSRNGAGIADAKVVPYENSVVDLSTLSALYPSIMEVVRDVPAGPTPSSGFADNIAVNYVEGGTSKSLNLYVINTPSVKARFSTQTSTLNLTDYGNGKFCRPDFSMPAKVSPLTGYPYTECFTYGQTSAANTLAYRPIGGTGGTAIQNGAKYNSMNPSDIELVTTGGTGIFGYIRYERKYPYCPDPKKRVTLRWLNSHGFPEFMYFDQYRIMPNYLINYSGGNRILSYEVTVGTTVTDDNEKALLQLSRASDVAGVFPIDTTQFARVTIMNPTAFNAQGGALGRAVNFKCKFEILEP